MLKDFQNFSMERCKNLILEYQQERKEEQFALLLARFDKYILYVIYELRSRWKYLRDEELQELYHTGIIGFHKGILAFKPHVSVKMVIPVLKAYIKGEMGIVYSYKDKELCCENPPSSNNVEGIEDNLTAKLILSSSAVKGLAEMDRNIVKLRFCEDLSVQEIADKYNVTKSAIYYRLKKTLTKLKKVIKN